MDPSLRRASLQHTAAQSSTPSQGRRATVPDLTTALPTSALFPTHHLPFRFGAEFEVIIRPRANLLQDGLVLPDFDASTRQQRDYNLALRRTIADILTTSGLPCDIYDPNDGGRPDTSRWNAVLDGSLSKKHAVDGFYPIEIVSPIIIADSRWVQIIDKFWSVLTSSFEIRCEFSCGFHVHISSATETWSLAQLRQMAKAVLFWEPRTARCAPPSRQDQVLGMCKSNVDNAVPAGVYLRSKGFQAVCDHIENLGRDEIINFVCPDKYKAWNFRNCAEGGFGSIEFRRPPGVVDAKRAKHWIAFTMAFVEMAIQFNPAQAFHQPSLLNRNLEPSGSDSFDSDCFKTYLLACAKQLGIFAQLDPRLYQVDNTRSLHITTLGNEALEWLQQHDQHYHFSVNR